MAAINGTLTVSETVASTGEAGRRTVTGYVVVATGISDARTLVVG